MYNYNKAISAYVLPDGFKFFDVDGVKLLKLHDGSYIFILIYNFDPQAKLGYYYKHKVFRIQDHQGVEFCMKDISNAVSNFQKLLDKAAAPIFDLDNGVEI